jgi:pheophorbidase
VLLQGLEFVFVHGAFHGSWCWYRILTSLRNQGFKATAIDMVSNGRDKTNPDTVTSLAQFTKPLSDYFTNNVTGKVG